MILDFILLTREWIGRKVQSLCGQSQRSSKTDNQALRKVMSWQKSHPISKGCCMRFNRDSWNMLFTRTSNRSSSRCQHRGDIFGMERQPVDIVTLKSLHGAISMHSSKSIAFSREPSDSYPMNCRECGSWMMSTWANSGSRYSGPASMIFHDIGNFQSIRQIRGANCYVKYF